jgi:hypothetical protein
MGRNRRRATVITTAALLVLVWRVSPVTAPPLYDGICIADPYRGLGTNPAPSSATKMYPPSGAFPTSEIVTNENPPQAQLLMTDGTFSSPQSTLTVSITPIPAPPVQPDDGPIDGNVYRFSAMTTSGESLQPLPHNPVTLLLRATRGSPPRTVERLDGTKWTPLQTFNSGCGDTFEAVSDRLGDFATVVTGQANPPAPSGSGPPLAAIIAAGVVVVIAAALLLVRLNRSPGD